MRCRCSFRSLLAMRHCGLRECGDVSVPRMCLTLPGWWCPKKRPHRELEYIGCLWDGERNKVTAQSHPKRGKECITPRCQGKRHADYRSSEMPASPYEAKVRNTTGCSVDQFKRTLDRFMCTVPDEPLINGYTSQRRSDTNNTNSLLDMIRFACAHPDLLVEVPRGQSPLSRERLCYQHCLGTVMPKDSTK